MGVVSENPHSGMPPARPQDPPAALGGARRSLSPAPLASEFGRHRQNCGKKSETVAKTQIFPSSQAAEAVVKCRRCGSPGDLQGKRVFGLKQAGVRLWATSGARSNQRQRRPAPGPAQSCRPLPPLYPAEAGLETPADRFGQSASAHCGRSFCSFPQLGRTAPRPEVPDSGHRNPPQAQGSQKPCTLCFRSGAVSAAPWHPQGPPASLRRSLSHGMPRSRSAGGRVVCHGASPLRGVPQAGRTGWQRPPATPSKVRRK